MTKNLTLENSYLKVVISTLGAELISLFDKRDEVEHMWEADPQFWPRRAPVLFPCVGESRDGKITVDSVDYSMVRHGFTRMQEFVLVEQHEDSFVLELKDNEETLKHYPYSFRLRVVYSLKENRLEQTFEVKNTDSVPLGFQIGGHPAFAVPFGNNGVYSDYCVKFDQDLSINRHLLSTNGLYTGETRSVLDGSDQLDLFYDLFNGDALVFKNIPSKRVWITRKDGGKRLEVRYDDFLHLGIWSIPGANYVCIEPWIGCADMVNQENDFFSKDSLITLQPNGEFSASFAIELIQ